MFFSVWGIILHITATGWIWGEIKKKRKRNHLVKDKSNKIVLIVSGGWFLMGPPAVVLLHFSTL